MWRHRTSRFELRIQYLVAAKYIGAWGACPKLGEPLCEILGPDVLSQALSSVWGNQCPNFRVDVTLNQRGAALPPLVQRFYYTSLCAEGVTSEEYGKIGVSQLQPVQNPIALLLDHSHEFQSYGN